MADPQAVAVLAEGAAADLAMSDIGLFGSMALAEPTVLDMVLCEWAGAETSMASLSLGFTSGGAAPNRT